MSLPLDVGSWSQLQFGACELGDKRRTRRLVKMAEKIATNPSASFPVQMEKWSDLKAAYRLFDQEEATHTAICSPHWQQTRAVEPGRYLIINDTTELDFGIKRQVQGLGPTGNGLGRGFLAHSALLLNANSSEIKGLAAQTIHYRKPQRKEENASQKRKRDRESEVWGRVIDAVGPPPPGAQLVHVCDRGADNFEVYCHAVDQRADWLIRIAHKHRKIITPAGEKTTIAKYLTALTLFGTYELTIRSHDKRAARVAHIEVRAGALSVPPPAHKSAYVKNEHCSPIAMNVIWVREVNAPDGVQALEWVLFTSLPVETFAQSWECIEYYEKRWLIEEYHKALKTGCQVTGRNLQEAERLEAMLGLLSIVAVRLLQLKSVARTNPDRHAKQIVPSLWLTMLQTIRPHLKRFPNMTIYQFYRELAKLGGFLGRKHDGEPGWITIWRGWEKLNLMVRGAEAYLGIE